MRNYPSKIALTAGFLLAMSFTLSCSGNDSSNNAGCSTEQKTVNGGNSDKGNDIKNYKTVKLGDQTWMAENLNYNITGSKCYGECGQVVEFYDEENYNLRTLSNAEIQANCDKYGRLYGWATAMALPSSCNSSSCASQISAKHKGICPLGWHIPSYEEWETLGNYIGTNDFLALPSGAGDGKYGFKRIGENGYWWNASEYNSKNAYRRVIRYSNKNIESSYDDKSNLYSVRCIKD